MGDDIVFSRSRSADKRPIVTKGISYAYTNLGDDLEDISSTIAPPPTGYQQRYLFVCLGFWGFFVVYALRINLSVAVIDIALQYKWDSAYTGIVLSSFFYGYLCTQVVGGSLAEKYGAKWVTNYMLLFVHLCSSGLLCWCICHRTNDHCNSIGCEFSFFAHWCSSFRRSFRSKFHHSIKWHPNPQMQAMTYPAMHAMIGAWAHPNERTQFATVIYAGAFVGTVVSLPLSGALCASSFLGGWPSVFYMFGSVSMLWCVAWAFLVQSRPADDPRVPPAELAYIQFGQAEQQQNSASKRQVAIADPRTFMHTCRRRVYEFHLCPPRTCRRGPRGTAWRGTSWT
jgi:MFS family permease